MKPVTCKNFVVLGGGLNGAAAAFQLSEILKADNVHAEVTLFERGKTNATFGGSAGETRITRKISYENPDVIPGMVEFSNAVLYALGAVKPVATILVGNNPRYLDDAAAAAVSSGARYSYLSAKYRQELSYLNTEGFDGILEFAMDENGDGAGIINPELAIKKMLERAESNGVSVRYEAAVNSIAENPMGKVKINLASGEVVEADKVISAAGVWNDQLIGKTSASSLYTKPKVLKVFWFKLQQEKGSSTFPNLIFKIKGGNDFAASHPDFATKYPSYDFSSPSTEEGFYVLQEELSDGTYLKFGHIQPVPKVKENPDVLFERQTITNEHEAFIASFIKEFMPGVVRLLPDVSRGRASFTRTYLESFSNDFMPVIGPRHTDSNVIVMAGFSGIGAKFAVASGRYAALHALNKAELIPENAKRLFNPDRKALRPKPPATWQINGNLGAPGPDGTVQAPPCLDMGLLGEKAARLYRNGYPANPGILEARIAVANMFNRFNHDRRTLGRDIGPNHIFLATGGATDANQIAIDHAKSKHGLDVRPRALLITPVYHLYIGQLLQSGFEVDYVNGVDKHDIGKHTITPQTDAEILAEIESNIKPETWLLFINSPRNPDGKIYSRELLDGILKILNSHPYLRIISDTIYKQVAPCGQLVNTLFGLANDEQRKRLYETDGTSKSVAKTMDRAAWLISDAQNIDEIAMVSHLKRGRPALPQMLQIVSMDEYLATNAPAYVEKNSAMYLCKLAYVAAMASQVAGLYCSPHLGAYYGYLDLRAVDFGAPMTAVEKENAVVDSLIVKGIAVSPGSNFKHAGALRFNASFNNQTLQRLMSSIVDTFDELGAKVTRREYPLPVIDSPDYAFQPYPVGLLSTQSSGVVQILNGKKVHEDENRGN